MERKKNAIDAFVQGASNGMMIALKTTIPNILFAFVLIEILNITGLLGVIGTAFAPIMQVFGLPGQAATVLAAAFMSMGGGVGVAVGLLANGDLLPIHIPVILPAIYLMGSQIQFIGRVGGAAELPNKFIPHIVGISILNAFACMFVLRLIF